MPLPQRFVATCRRTRRRITLCNMCIVRFLCRFFLLRGSSILFLAYEMIRSPILEEPPKSDLFLPQDENDPICFHHTMDRAKETLDFKIPRYKMFFLVFGFVRLSFSILIRSTPSCTFLFFSDLSARFWTQK